ncbi:MAG: O-antigen ligase family protein [Gemmatimonadales bacterium]
MTTLPAPEVLASPIRRTAIRLVGQSGRREREAIHLFRWLLAIYTGIVITKIHELVPVVNRLQPAKIVGVLLLATAFIVLRPRSILAVLRSPPAACVLVISLLAVLSVPGAVWPGNSAAFLATVYWKTLLLFVISATAWCDRVTLRRTLAVLVICQTVVAVALLTGAAHAVVGRAYVGTALDPNESALQLLVVIPFALYIAASGGAWKPIGIASMLLLVAGVVRTGSRAGFIGLIVLAGWMLVQVRPRRRRWMASLAVAAGAVVVVLTASDATRQRFSTILHPTEDYNFTYREGRVDVWKRGLGYMWRRPIFGVGVQDFPVAEGVLSGKKNEGYGIKYSAAHNMFVQIGAELGVIGLLAFSRMLWAAAAGSRRIRRLGRTVVTVDPKLAKHESNLAEAALGALVALLVGGFFLSVAYAPVTFFVVAVCIAVRLGSPLPTWAGGGGR